jgi:hypothetical protein
MNTTCTEWRRNDFWCIVLYKYHILNIKPRNYSAQQELHILPKLTNPMLIGYDS